MAFAYRVTVYRANLQRQFQKGGQGGIWLDKLRLAMHRACVREAPSRSGDLKGSHESFLSGARGGGYRAEATIWNTAEHAEWVHEGVAGRIFPHGDYLWVPRRRGSTARVKRTSVKGQAANPWMDRACQRVARRNGAF